MWNGHRWQWSARSLLALALTVSALSFAACDDEANEPFRIAYLGDFSGDLAEFAPQIQQGAELAIEHVNAAGGVDGEPVELLVGDTGSEPATAVAEATRLVEDEGAHAFVGPLGTDPAIAVVREVSRVLEIPTITPSATSPALSDLEDGGFLFRTAISDAAQGPILAQLVAADLQADNVAVLFEESAYGRGLMETFDANYAGQLLAVPYRPGQSSFRGEIETLAGSGATHLIAIGYPAEATTYLQEALDQGAFDQFVFVDGTRSLELLEAIGPDRLDGARGTAPAPGPETDASRAFDDAFTERFGALPSTPFVREAYDATIALALAAQAAGSRDGADIAAALPAIANPGGDPVTPGIEALRLGLDRLRNDGDVNYRGAASAVDFDARGDLATGYVGIWTYQDGGVVELEAIPFDLN